MSKFYFDPFFQAFTGSGNTIAGAKLTFFVTNTTTLKDTFQDSALTITNTNPVIADGSGRFPDIYFETGLYSVKYEDADSVTIDTIDDFGGAITSAVETLAVVDPVTNTGTATDPIIGLNADFVSTSNYSIWKHFL